jgi:lipopolysaccharide/colanic/teichoic acid biosynthesis glycosyltransferase
LAKRASDIVLGLFGLCIIGLITPIIALINALTSPGPLFYWQTRVGAGGRPFALVKFRTMSPSAEKENFAVWAQKNDKRVTFLGRLMRKFRIDELPQVINVLKGEMSIIGPRPERPQFVGEISRELPIYRSRHCVKPGITGWAQVYYHYGSSIEDARIKLEYDLYYIKHAGFWVDLLIGLRTLPVMLLMRGL